MSDPLDVRGLQLSYGAVRVLTDVDLHVPAHSFTAVLGASGSGKTTLLRSIAGFERPGAGTIEIAGRIVDGPGAHVTPERRRIGYVAQEGALFPHLTVASNVGFGVPRRRRTSARIDGLLELVGLAGLGRRYPHELSGGQQQRVALARALAVEPAVVLLDEPFASLDAALRTTVRRDIAHVLRESGSTVVLVTHDQQEALSLADQVAVLRGGRIAQAGTPHDLYARPVDADMAQFLGEANLVRAAVRGTRVDTLLGTLSTSGPDGDDAARSAGLALVRPEQVVILDATAEEGVPGVVVEQTFHGHDSIVTVRPLSPGAYGSHGSATVRVRVLGAQPFPAGLAVRLHAAGETIVWPLDR